MRILTTEMYYTEFAHSSSWESAWMTRQCVDTWCLCGASLHHWFIGTDRAKEKWRGWKISAAFILPFTSSGLETRTLDIFLMKHFFSFIFRSVTSLRTLFFVCKSISRRSNAPIGILVFCFLVVITMGRIKKCSNSLLPFFHPDFPLNPDMRWISTRWIFGFQLRDCQWKCLISVL